jgi:hypothetical protein
VVRKKIAESLCVIGAFLVMLDLAHMFLRFEVPDRLLYIGLGIFFAGQIVARSKYLNLSWKRVAERTADIVWLTGLIIMAASLINTIVPFGLPGWTVLLGMFVCSIGTIGKHVIKKSTAEKM